MEDQQLIHRIALSMLKGIGPVNARNLVSYCGGVDPIFDRPQAEEHVGEGTGHRTRS
jgi:hypothetical protein